MGYSKQLQLLNEMERGGLTELEALDLFDQEEERDAITIRDRVFHDFWNLYVLHSTPWPRNAVEAAGPIPEELWLRASVETLRRT